MLKSVIGLSIIASSVIAIDEVTVVDQLSCKTFSTNDALAGVYEYFNPSNKDWSLYMPQTDYLLVHETGKSTVSEGAEVVPSTDFTSIMSTGDVVFGDYTGSNTRAMPLANSTLSINHDSAGLYNRFDANNNLWFLYIPQNNYLLVHETGKAKVQDGALVINEGNNFSQVQVDATAGTVRFIPKNGCGGLKPQETLPSSITSDMTLTKDKLWLIDGLVVVESGATLTIEPGTTLAGYDGTGAQSSYMVIDKGAKIMAEGTAAEPIIFTSTKVEIDGAPAAVGQWGGLTLIGNAGNPQVKPYEVNADFVATDTNMTDSSGVLKYVQVLNSGITMEKDKEINGVSFVGVGSGTTVENITVAKSDDDCIELWGGTVNLTHIDLSECTDDHFDIDDGFSGTVKDLTIMQTTGNAAIEMSGTTHATFDGFNIVQNASAKEGGIYFKKDGIGGHFKNGTMTDNVDDANGAIHSQSADGVSDTVDAANTSFENVILNGTSTGPKFTGTSAATLEAIFDKGNVKPQETLPSSITSDMTLTKDKLWLIDGLVVVESGATLTIEPGTTLAGYDGTGAQSSYMVIDKGAKIMAEGTAAEPIIFTSTKVAIDGAPAAVGQWGGLTLIGNAGNPQVKPYEVNADFVAGNTDMTDSSGVLKYVQVLNSGITMEKDKEINGVSFVGVGSGTTVENITVAKSDDDCIELWGGTVNLTHIDLSECTDDHFDIDDGFSGTVKDLNITATIGNAAIEMSGTTHATFDGFNIVQNGSAKEGGIYFKKDGIGGHFKNGTMTDNVDDANGAIHSQSADGVSDTVDAANTSFANVTLNGTSTGAKFTGTSAATLEAIFDKGTGNTK